MIGVVGATRFAGNLSPGLRCEAFEETPARLPLRRRGFTVTTRSVGCRSQMSGRAGRDTGKCEAKPVGGLGVYIVDRPNT